MESFRMQKEASSQSDPTAMDSQAAQKESKSVSSDRRSEE